MVSADRSDKTKTVSTVSHVTKFTLSFVIASTCTKNIPVWFDSIAIGKLMNRYVEQLRDGLGRQRAIESLR